MSLKRVRFSERSWVGTKLNATKLVVEKGSLVQSD